MDATGMVVRLTDDAAHAYDRSGNRVAEFPVGEAVDCAVAPDLRRAVYTTDAALVCVHRDGSELWRLEFGTGATPFFADASCAFSLDGAAVWLYRPDALTRRGPGGDRWVAVDAGTGRVIAQTELDCTGHGATHFVHPDGVHFLLDVGEGHGGLRVYRGRLDRDTIEVTSYPWQDRTLIDLAPDGRHFMTVDHQREEAAFHAYPDGEVVARTRLDAFDQDDEILLQWAGGYLDGDTAIVAIGGESEDEEWFEYHLVDVRTGEVRGPIDMRTEDVYDVHPLGNGSWFSGDEDGELVHYTG